MRQLAIDRSTSVGKHRHHRSGRHPSRPAHVTCWSCDSPRAARKRHANMSPQVRATLHSNRRTIPGHRPNTPTVDNAEPESELVKEES